MASVRATYFGSTVIEPGQCSYIFDGTDTDGTGWYLCTEHDYLNMGADWPCEGWVNAQ